MKQYQQLTEIDNKCWAPRNTVVSFSEETRIADIVQGKAHPYVFAT
jgi:hypothetical protein